MRYITLRYQVAFVLAAATSFLSIPALGSTRLVESGSTLLYPLMNVWAAAYAQSAPGIAIATQETGSGQGIREAVEGTAQIGASDAYMSDEELKKSPMLNIPLAVSAQLVVYNLAPFKAHLNFTGPLLAAIYSGEVRYWDDPRITSLNPEFAHSLIHQPIVTIRRADSSGDTFIFSQYLAKSTPSWSKKPGFGSVIAWANLPGEIAAKGNKGMLQAAATTPYSIAYIGISLFDDVRNAGLGYAALGNQAGKFVFPTSLTIASAINATYQQTPPDARISLVFAPGDDSYPIINYEYAIVRARLPSAATADAIRKFLRWVVDPDGGQQDSYLSRFYFLPLPQTIVPISRKLIESIH